MSSKKTGSAWAPGCSLGDVDEGQVRPCRKTSQAWSRALEVAVDLVTHMFGDEG